MKIGQRKGFSLIEIGIVMVVIGLIIAAVMKGKDVIKSAEMKQNNQAFFNKWVNVGDGYYDKTQLFLDVNTTAGIATAVAAVDAAGLAHPDSSVLLSGEQLDDVNVTVYFKTNVTIKTNNVDGLKRNLTCFSNVPGDLAISFDRLVDGVADGKNGANRIIGALTTRNTPEFEPNSASLEGIAIDTISASSTYEICRIHEHLVIAPPQNGNF